MGPGPHCRLDQDCPTCPIRRVCIRQLHSNLVVDRLRTRQRVRPDIGLSVGRPIPTSTMLPNNGLALLTWPLALFPQTLARLVLRLDRRAVGIKRPTIFIWLTDILHKFIETVKPLDFGAGMTDRSVRAAWALDALKTFQRRCDCGDELAYADLICALGLLADESGFNFLQQLRLGLAQWRVEGGLRENTSYLDEEAVRGSFAIGLGSKHSGHRVQAA